MLSVPVSPSILSVPCVYSYNPYSMHDVKRQCLSPSSLTSSPSEFSCDNPNSETKSKRNTTPLPNLRDFHLMDSPNAQPPRHPNLSGVVEYLPYPEVLLTAPSTDTRPDDLQRLFFGQLPYHVTDRELSYIVYQLARVSIFNMEPIVRWSQGRQPSGCAHVYCHTRDTQTILDLLSGRILFDEVGVWVARSETEQQALEEYCRELKGNLRPRPFEMPYQLLSVAIARSNYVPRDHHRRILQRDHAARGGRSFGSHLEPAGYFHSNATLHYHHSPPHNNNTCEWINVVDCSMTNMNSALEH